MNNESYYLIVWDNTEEVVFYLVPSSKVLEEFSYDEIISLHGKYLGSSNNDDDEDLLEALSNTMLNWENYKRYNHIYAKNINIELVICIGMIL